MKKCVIIVGIAGIAGPVLTYFNLYTLLSNLAGGPLSKVGGWLYIIEWILFPFGFLMMDIDPGTSPYFFWSIYILAAVLNIGLFAFLGYIIGSIVQAIKRK